MQQGCEDAERLKLELLTTFSSATSIISIRNPSTESIKGILNRKLLVKELTDLG
jgi:hypothetical protein